ncbi:hypothetical protein Tco_0400428 [Tanacetum coccineum]
MQVARDRQKSYTDKVMLKVSPWKGVIRFGKRGKLNPRYVGPFKVLEKVGSVAYKIELPYQKIRLTACRKHMHLDVLACKLDLNGLKDMYNKDYTVTTLISSFETSPRPEPTQGCGEKPLFISIAKDTKEGRRNHDDRTFTSQAWNMLFRIQEKVVSEYVMEVLLSYTFREHIVDLDNDDTIFFQLGGIRRSRHNGKEKVTLDDLFLLHSMDGGAKVDVPWHVAKFFTNKAKGYKKKSPIVGAHLIGKIARSYGLMTHRSLRSVTLGPKTSLLSVVKLVDMGICRYNRLGYGEMVDDLPDNGEDEAAKAGVGKGQDDDGGVRRRPNMTFSNRLRAIDERLGDIETNISTLSIKVDDLTYVVSGMSEQYDQFNGEFGQMRVQQGVNFMSNTLIYPTAPSSSPNPFSLFGDANAGPSIS